MCDEGSGKCKAHLVFILIQVVTVSHPIGGNRILQSEVIGSLLIRTKGKGVIESMGIYTRILQVGGV